MHFAMSRFGVFCDPGAKLPHPPGKQRIVGRREATTGVGELSTKGNPPSAATGHRDAAKIVEEMIVKARIRLDILRFVAAALFALMLAACGGQSADQSTSSAQPPFAPQPSKSRAAAPPTNARGATPTVSLDTPLSVASSTPGANANASASPRSVATGSVTLELSLEPARHMFAEASTTGANGGAQPTPSGGANDKNASAGSAVFAGSMVGATNNVDAAQAPPADSSQAIIRHVVVHVRTKNGHPVAYDQALEPMTAVDKNPPQFYYGNNVQFPQRGTYQVFVRIEPNPLLGKGKPAAAQFNVTLR